MEKAELHCPECGEKLRKVAVYGEFVWVHTFLTHQGPSKSMAACGNFKAYLSDDGKVISIDELKRRQKERWQGIKEV